ncbi:lysophospholipid acyltransferase family protein [Ancrocorticia populi]|uniref:lysophospholipid acyltransferase family protein n=1 Tax=Ancrocorticia populi TaxID=2175228 RepID=UPI00235597BE|nr:lysophospholipid acyltransferase family protein [Ancrocorticia populi]
MAAEGAKQPPLMRVLAPPVRWAMHAIQDMQVEGAENLPAGRPIIAVGNHTSHLDGPVAAVALYEAGVIPHTAAKADLFTIPVLGWALRQLGQVPVYRPGVLSTPADGSSLSTLGELSDVIGSGGSVLMFPEATFTRDPEQWPMRAKTGAVRLALEHPEAVVVPFAHWGNEELINKWSGKIDWRAIGCGRTSVRVRFGQPVDLSGFRGRVVTRDLLSEATECLMAAITSELTELRPGVPREPRWDREKNGDPYNKIDARNQARAKNRGTRLRSFGAAGLGCVALAGYYMGRRRK